jgi:iron complex transport system permease protein
MKASIKLFSIMFIILITVTITATALGAVYVPFFDTARIILKNIGINLGGSYVDFQESIIFQIRFPRVLAGILVGAALATSGCVMQSMFRNPMAEPGLLGISSGSGLGAVISISLGLTIRSLPIFGVIVNGIYIMPIFAILGAFSTALLVYFLSIKGGKIPVLTLVLSGIVVSTFVGALTSLIISRMNHYQVNEYIFWAMGSLSGILWENLGIVYIPIIIGIIVINLFSKDLNILLLGEEEAQSVGLNPSGTRRKMIFMTSIITALAVCISGNISFVGLIVPHIMRLLVGPDNRILLPASAIGGAIFMVGCDLIARTVIMPSEIGVGIVTSIIGAPYFLYLLNRARKEGVVI